MESRDKPRVVDRTTGDTFRVMTDVEVIVENNNNNDKPAVDEQGRVRVEDVLTGEEVKESKPWEEE